MKTMEEFRKEAIEQGEAFANCETDMESIIDWMVENFPQENHPETAKPKPRWRDKTYGNTYTVRKVDGGWKIWFVANQVSRDHQSTSAEINKTFPSVKEANNALDNYCIKYLNLERCDEEEEESFGEVLAEIRKLRDKLGLGVIFGLADGLWGIKENNVAGIYIGARYTLPELRDFLQKKAEPEPVTREQVKEAANFVLRVASFATTEEAKKHSETLERFIRELQ